MASVADPVAAIDLGTNTARLLIGTCHGESIRQHLIMRRITRLGGGFTRERGISAEAEERTLAALMEFGEQIGLHGVKRIKAVATSAVRDAANGNSFCRTVHQKTGIKLEVIDGHTEGILTLRGVLSSLDTASENLLVFDVGGGSTEYTLACERKALFSQSLPLGVVRLTEGKATISAKTDKIARELDTLKEELEKRGLLSLVQGANVVGTAGTATTLAAISMEMVDYDYRRVNNYRISREEIAAIFDRLLPLTPEERLRIKGMEKGREDLIIAGTLITLKTLELFGRPFLTVSDFGLLEGLLLSICEE